MSDFDKEAEREKLREKYEREAEKREATEQMSELLLKGATMTNAHCSDCGDPIFRYDGQEFCPSCQKPIDRQGEDAGADVNGDDGDRPAESGGNAEDDHIEVTTPSESATVRFGGTDGSPEASGSEADTEAGAADGREGASAPDRAERARDQSETPTQPSAAATRPSGETDLQSSPSHAAAVGTGSPDTGPHGTTPQSGGSSGGSAGDHLGSARVILAQTVERFAGRAAEADSPREAREHLQAAREAAETLDAL